VSKAKGKKVVRRSKSRTTEQNSPASLPPQVTSVDPDAPDSAKSVPEVDTSVQVPTVSHKKPFWDVGKQSKQYEQAMKILALRATGLDDKAIADAMGLSMQTVWNYCYVAGKNGWGEDFQNAKDQIEFRIMPKVVRELEAGLDDRHRNEKTGLQVATAVALKVAEMTIAKRFEQTSSAQPISNVIAIRIENVGGGNVEVREGNIGGTPAYADGDTVDGTLAE
jgi:hypothetical protein